jgi:ArsR family transcriptional regulator
MDIDSMRQAATQAGALLRALGNEDREMSVGELAQALEIRQPTLSQQLGVLRQEGLVSTRRDGKQIYYAVCDRKALALLNTLYQLFCPAREERP